MQAGHLVATGGLMSARANRATPRSVRPAKRSAATPSARTSSWSPHPAVFHARERHSYFRALGGRAEEMIPIVCQAISMTLDCAEAQISSRAA